MHRITLFIFFFIVPLILFSQEKADTLPKGWRKFYHSGGELSSEGVMVNGKPDGYWRSYHENGVLKSEGNRKEFKLDGLWKFYDVEGDIKLEIEYSNDLKNGYRITYTEEGRIHEYFEDDVKEGMTHFYDTEGFLFRTVPFENGREQGLAKYYNRDSLVITVMEYQRGVAISREFINRYDAEGKPHGYWKTFWNNGLLRAEFSYLHGKLDGYYKRYDKEENLEVIEKYSDGVLIPDSDELVVYEIRRNYYDNMAVKIEGSYRDDVADGVRKEFNIDGTLKVAYIIDMGRVIGTGILDAQGKKQGNWSEYYKEGGLRGEGNYQDGIRIGEWNFYFPHGSLEQRGEYTLKGKEHGRWLWYYSDGIMRREENFSNGLKDGEMAEYDEHGKVIANGNYVDGEEDGFWLYQEEGYRQEGNFNLGEPDGEWVHYYPDGNISFRGKFMDGYPDGKHFWYHFNGKIKTEGNYIVGVRHGLWRHYTEEGVLMITIEYKNGVEIRYDNHIIKPVIQGTDL